MDDYVHLLVVDADLMKKTEKTPLES